MIPVSEGCNALSSPKSNKYLNGGTPPSTTVVKVNISLTLPLSGPVISTE